MPTVIFLPFAGAGASMFRTWSANAKGRFSVLAVQLPNREERFIDEPLTSVADAADDAVTQVVRTVPPRSQVAVFGHSLGAVLAFEVAKRLEAGGRYEVVGLFASGSPGPWEGRADRASDLDDNAFLAQVRRFAGYDHPALAMPEMRDLLMPMLRADVRMHEEYVPADGTRLSAPVVALRGADDELVDASAACQWSNATAGQFTYRELPGKHMYLVESVQAVTDLIADDLDRLVTR